MKREGKPDMDSSHKYLDGRLEFAFKLIVLLISMVLLLLPVALLYLLNTTPSWVKLVIIFVFVILFTTVTLYLTKAKRNEVFVSVAT
jgi:hypothetical protein